MLDPKLRNNSFEFGAQLNPDPALILRTLAEAREIAGEDLDSTAAGAVVKIRGFAHPGPDGVLTAPLSGQPCVWYRSAFFPGAGFAPVPSVAPSDGIPALNDYRSRRVMNPSEEISTAAFTVGDRSRGAVRIDPIVADVDTDVLAANQQWHGERGLSAGLMVEWILPPGAPVIATGTLGTDRSLLATPDAALLVSTKDERDIVARDTAGASYDAHRLAATTLRMQRFSVRFAGRFRTVRNVAIALFAVFTLVMVILIVASRP